MAIYGHSYGGHIVHECAGAFGFVSLPALHPQVSGDWVVEMETDFDETLQFNIQQRFELEQKAYNSSAISQIERWGEEPLLFLHGDNDPYAAMKQPLELYHALRRRGVEASAVTFPGEDHGIQRHASRLRYLKAMDEFLNTHIGVWTIAGPTMRFVQKYFIIATLLTAGCATIAPDNNEDAVPFVINDRAAATIENLLQSPAVQRAFGQIDSSQKSDLEWMVRLNEIPAPSFKEADRAAYFAKLLTDTGLSVEIDEVGNVIGRFQGTGDGPSVAFVAHLDTVFPLDTDVSVRRDGHTFIAPWYRRQCPGSRYAC